MQNSKKTKAWGTRCLLLTIVLLLVFISKNAKSDAFDTLDIVLMLLFSSLFIAGIVLNIKKETPHYFMDNDEDTGSKTEDLIRNILVVALLQFAKKNKISVENIPIVVNHIIYNNQLAIRGWNKTSTLELNARKSHLTGNEVHFEFVEVVLSTDAVQIHYISLDIPYTETLKR